MGDPERCQELDPKRHSRPCHPNGISGSTANLYIGPAIAFVVRSGILRRTLPATIVEGSFTANQDMKILHNISEDFDVRFIHHLVRPKEVGIRSSCAKTGTTVESIDFQKLLEFELRLPLISEQKEIVRLVDSKLESLNQAETLVQKPLATLNALRDSLVSTALSGRLT
ncbi:restriction endonuclease subunit S [Corynebacterium diphtheriae]|nr:restriction endonuclease subunit S [Corynebacterium diphtheriae]